MDGSFGRPLELVIEVSIEKRFQRTGYEWAVSVNGAVTHGVGKTQQAAKGAVVRVIEEALT